MLTDDEKNRVRSLCNGAPPQTGLEKHFLLVLAGKARACSDKEKQWVQIANEVSHDKTHSSDRNSVPSYYKGKTSQSRIRSEPSRSYAHHNDSEEAETLKRKLESLENKLENKERIIQRQEKDIKTKEEKINKLKQKDEKTINQRVAKEKDSLTKKQQELSGEISKRQGLLRSRDKEIDKLKDVIKQYEKKYGPYTVEKKELKDICDGCQGDGGAAGQCRKCDGTGWKVTVKEVFHVP